MVFVNNQKFACESCIKGHRSSSCSHTDRPLYEIKKKGRPVSQCERCRELRSSKRLHSKCTCSDGPSKSRDTEKAFGTKQKRYIPIVPALPNGLKDAVGGSSTGDGAEFSDPRQKVVSLLNPCKCVDVWNCQCSSKLASASASENALLPANNGLATLARAAALCCADVTPSQSETDVVLALNSSSRRTSHGPSPLSSPEIAQARKHCRSPTPTQSPTFFSHAKRARSVKSPEVGPALPPLQLPYPDDRLASASFASPSLSPDMPNFPIPMPSFSTITSLAGTGCTCGVRCSCPGCVEHGLDDDSNDADGTVPCHGTHANASHSAELDFEAAFSGDTSTLSTTPKGHEKQSCGDGCEYCVDESLRELDLSNVGNVFNGWHGPVSGMLGGYSALESFFVHAARVPPPGGKVALPKLCCGGSCGCGRGCVCGSECGGCCDHGGGNGDQDEEGGGHSRKSSSPVVSSAKVAPVQKKSCCSSS